MEPSLPRATALLAVLPLVTAGISAHWVRPFAKAPIQSDWSKRPVYTIGELETLHQENANIGIRLGEPSKTTLGYMYLIDLDIRNESLRGDALLALDALLPGFAKYPSVISGSGGSSRHYYFICDKLFKSRKLAKSDTFTMVWDAKKQRDVKKNDWEIELFGSGKQAVLPPSIHPDTNAPYVWEQVLDLDLIDLGVGPVLSAAVVESWGVSANTSDNTDSEDLFAIVTQSPVGLESDEIDKILSDIPSEWAEDRDQWLTVGAALHHEFEGSSDGFSRWCEWSEQSEKYDEKDQSRVWKSFKGAVHPVRMVTLIQAANQNRLFSLSSDSDDVPEKPVVKIDENWRSYLQFTEDGALKSTLPNAQLIISNDPRTASIVGHNEFTHDNVLVRAPGTFKLKKPSPKPIRQLTGAVWRITDPVNGVLWKESHDHQVRAFMEAPVRQGGYGVKVSDRDLNAALDMSAQANAFHPVREYLDRLVWDGVTRIDTLFVDYLGCAHTPYHREAARLTMLGAVSRIYEPGHKFDFVPILEGVQGKGKSTFIKILGHRWTQELSGDFHDMKTMVEQMQGSWIMEIPELQGFSKVDTTILKAFLSKPVDRVRLAYARRPQDYPRQCIFIGSTNDKEYLRDTTGGRRFWPIKCNIDGDIDNKLLLQNLDQLWAESVAAYRTLRETHGTYGDLPLYIRDKVAAAEALSIQDSRRVESVEEGVAGEVAEWLNTPIGADFDDLDNAEPVYRNRICLKEIWHDMMNRDSASWDQSKALMLGRAMRMVPGWDESGRETVGAYGRQRVFKRAK